MDEISMAHESVRLWNQESLDGLKQTLLKIKNNEARFAKLLEEEIIKSQFKVRHVMRIRNEFGEYEDVVTPDV